MLLHFPHSQEKTLKTLFSELCYGHLGPVSQEPRTLFEPGRPQQKSRTYLRLQRNFHKILYMNRNFLRSRSFRRMHFCVFRCRSTENWFHGSGKVSGAFDREAVPSLTCLYALVIYFIVLITNKRFLLFGSTELFCNGKKFGGTLLVNI